MPGLYLDTLTWQEAEKALENTSVIVVPVGARTKEHGYHLQLNNDWLTAEYMTKRILEKCDNVIAVPTVQYGYYPAFINYPGSINISRNTFRDMIVDICTSMHRHKPGLRFYVQNGGISTNFSLEPARKILSEKGIVMEFTDLFVAGSETISKLEKQERGSHADEIETSMMMIIAPETVHIEKAVKDDNVNVPGPFIRFPPSDSSNQAVPGLVSPSGAWGDPTLASAEKGAPIVEAVLQYHLDRIAALGKKTTHHLPTMNDISDLTGDMTMWRLSR